MYFRENVGNEKFREVFRVAAWMQNQEQFGQPYLDETNLFAVVHYGSFRYLSLHFTILYIYLTKQAYHHF